MPSQSCCFQAYSSQKGKSSVSQVSLLFLYCRIIESLMKDIYTKYLKRGVINTHQFSVLTWYNARFYDMKWCDMILYNITWYLLDFIPLNWSGAWQSLSLKRYDMTQTFANYDMTSRDIRWYNGLTLYNIIWHYIILYFTARFQVKCRSPYLICMHFITHFSTFCYLQSSYFDNIW